MKLCRIGNIGNEKPALIDNENNYRDLSSVIDDFNPETLNFDTIEKIKNTETVELKTDNQNQYLTTNNSNGCCRLVR